MTVLILTNSDSGLYSFRRELLERLCQEYTVLIALPEGDAVPALEALGCRCIPFSFHRRGMNPFADIGQLLRYIRLIRRERPDIVLTYTIKPNVYGGLACQLTKTPYIATITGLGTAVENGGLLGRISASLYRAGLRKAGCVFFQNTANREFFIARNMIAVKTRLVPGSGVDLADHPVTAYPPPADTVRFLFAGRIMRDKGIEELLDAMHRLRKAHSDIFLEIIGNFDEDYAQALEQAEEEGFARHLPYQTNINAFYQAAHCVVLPSYHEGMSNVLLEAAASGRPVIATDVPGCRETFDEGVSGFGCRPGDAAGLAEAMEKFLALSWEERAAMGRAGRKKVEREFDRRIVVDAYMEEIETLK